MRGLKRPIRLRFCVLGGSHPTWVRGLKLVCIKHKRSFLDVAPYVGAWIETSIFGKGGVNETSHPTWVRGLKLRKLLLIKSKGQVAPYVGAWIETSVR